MKKIKIWTLTGTFIFFIFMMIATGGTKTGSNTPKAVTVDLGYYLGTCERFFEGEKSLMVTIAVDRYAGSGTIEDNYRTYHKPANNDQNLEENMLFPGIEVPEFGTFSLTVTVQGTTCYTCCTGPSCTGSGFQGNPYFRGVTTQYNKDNTPETIYVTPKQVSCL